MFGTQAGVVVVQRVRRFGGAGSGWLQGSAGFRGAGNGILAARRRAALSRPPLGNVKLSTGAAHRTEPADYTRPEGRLVHVTNTGVQASKQQMTKGTADIEAVFRRHHASLYAYAVRLSGDPEAASDAVQGAFVKLMENEVRSAEVGVWLLRVVTNALRDEARRRTRERRLHREYPDQLAVLLPTRETPPDEQEQRDETIRRVRVALEQISERNRQLLLMRESGYSYREISEVFGLRYGSVGTILARALKQFERVLLGSGDPPSGNDRRERDGSTGGVGPRDGRQGVAENR